jgi:hypothetical protein
LFNFVGSIYMNSIISIRARKYLNQFFHRPKVSSTKKHVEQCTKGRLSFISNRQRRKEGAFLCVGVGGDRTRRSRVCPPLPTTQHYTTAVLLSVLCSSLPLCRGTSTNDDHVVSARATPSLPTSQAISPILLQFQPQSFSVHVLSCHLPGQPTTAQRPDAQTGGCC